MRQTRLRKKLQKAILCIDWGSTAFRACFILKNCPELLKVTQNPDYLKNPGYNKGDFPGACCPLKPNPREFLGQRALDEPDSISSKYLMYLLAGADDILLRKYPISEKFITKRNDPEFLETCRNIIVELHKRLRASIDQSCQVKDLEYDEIVICVPVNWGDSFQREYLDIIRRVYPQVCSENMENVHIISESDASMHYMLEHCVGGQQRIDEDWDLFLLLDFGGHAMHFSLVQLDILDDSGRTSFIEVDSGCEAGGSELWSYYVSCLIHEKLKTTKDSSGSLVKDASGAMRWSLTRQFDHKKSRVLSDLLEDKLKPVQLYYDSGGVYTALTLSTTEIANCFEAGLREPINTARKMVGHLCNYKTKSLGVMVAGGSLNTPEMMRFLVDECPPSLEGRIRFTSSIQCEYLSASVANGGGLAVARRISVPAFFERGAAIFVQELKRALTNNLWNDFASLAVDQHSSHALKFPNRKIGDVSFKLVCDPAYSGRQVRTFGGAPIGSVHDCYDLMSLGTFPAGTILLKLEFRESGYSVKDLPYLALTVTRDHPMLKKSTTKELHVPLYFDPGHNCVHVDRDNFAEWESVKDGTWFTGTAKSPPSARKRQAAEPDEHRMWRRRVTRRHPERSSPTVGNLSPRTRTLENLSSPARTPGDLSSPIRTLGNRSLGSTPARPSGSGLLSSPDPVGSKETPGRRMKIPRFG